MSENKKGFLKYVNSKQRTKENISLIPIEDGYLAKRDEGKTESFDDAFALVFNNTTQSSESENHKCGNSDFLICGH